MWFRNLLTELHVPLAQVPVIYCDILNATHLSANPFFHSKMKHVALAFYFIWEQVQCSLLHVTHVPTGHQLPDFLTKPLSRPKLDLLLSRLEFRHTRPSCGGILRIDVRLGLNLSYLIIYYIRYVNNILYLAMCISL